MSIWQPLNTLTLFTRPFLYTVFIAVALFNSVSQSLQFILITLHFKLTSSRIEFPKRYSLAQPSIHRPSQDRIRCICSKGVFSFKDEQTKCTSCEVKWRGMRSCPAASTMDDDDDDGDVAEWWYNILSASQEITIRIGTTRLLRSRLQSPMTRQRNMITLPHIHHV